MYFLCTLSRIEEKVKDENFVVEYKCLFIMLMWYEDDMNLIMMFCTAL